MASPQQNDFVSFPGEFDQGSWWTNRHGVRVRQMCSRYVCLSRSSNGHPLEHVEDDLTRELVNIHVYRNFEARYLKPV